MQSDPAKVNTESTSLKKILKGVDMKLLKGDAHMKWMDQLKIISDNLEKIISSDDIDIQRTAFAELNLTFYKSIKMFGLDNLITYYQYCPMAVNDQGAYWFSEIKEIRNPYFGDMMLQCGETREVIE